MAAAAKKKTTNNVGNELARLLARRRALANRFVVESPASRPRPRPPPPPPPRLTAAQANAFWRELLAQLERRRTSG